jgi:hypothetical protein
MYNDEVMAATVIVQTLVEEEESRPRRGSVIGRQVVHRDRLSGHYRLMEDYFVPNPIYDDDFFVVGTWLEFWVVYMVWRTLEWNLIILYPCF